MGFGGAASVPLRQPGRRAAVDPAAAGVTQISVETTKQPVTTGIERLLPWLTNKGQSLDPGSSIDFSGHPPLAKRLRQRDFKIAW
jgi:hypothetical protein